MVSWRVVFIIPLPWRCPNCLAIGLDRFLASTDGLRSSIDITIELLCHIPYWLSVPKRPQSIALLIFHGVEAIVPCLWVIIEASFSTVFCCSRLHGSTCSTLSKITLGPHMIVHCTLTQLPPLSSLPARLSSYQQ